MQTVNALVALNGDRNNTVPKYNLTVPEVAVLGAIHGEDAVFDIVPVDDIEVSNRDEITRLRNAYVARDDDGTPIIDHVYPGRAPVLHTDMEDLGLDETLFKAETRVSPKSKKAPAKRKTSAAKKEEPKVEEQPADETAGDEGIMS